MQTKSYGKGGPFQNWDPLSLSFVKGSPDFEVGPDH
jgi:hypothetical protein